MLRDQWGWQAGERTLPNHSINKITIQHGGEDFPEDKDVLGYLSKFLKWCREEKQWIDYTETLCPGEDLYRYLLDGSIVKGVQQVLDNERSAK